MPASGDRIDRSDRGRSPPLVGGDGDSRVAAVWEAPDGAALEALAERRLAEDAELLGVFPTYVGQVEEA